MTLAQHVATLGRGPGRSRSLTEDEARDAMRLMLDPETAPEAVGALLMLLRMKGETADEIAGLAGAAQAALSPLPQADLDWPAYAAGRTRGLPWFLLSAKLVAQAGYRVTLHGWNGADETIRAGLDEAGIPVATPSSPITYYPLETLHPALFDLLSLRPVLGLRSCINTVCRMLNPSRASASVQGVFHPSYRLLQADAAARLGWSSLTVIKGGGGEFERNPTKPITGFGLREGAVFDRTWPALGEDAATRLSDGPAPDVTLSNLWSGEVDDAFATSVVIGTAALALDTLDAADPLERARTLWANRHHSAQEVAA